MLPPRYALIAMPPLFDADIACRCRLPPLPRQRCAFDAAIRRIITLYAPRHAAMLLWQQRARCDVMLMVIDALMLLRWRAHTTAHVRRVDALPFTPQVIRHATRHIDAVGAMLCVTRALLAR